jgi:outer membrane protein
MKLKKGIILIIAFLGLGLSNINAQSKFGYVNATELLYLMPEMKTVNHVLDSFQLTLDKEYKSLVDDFNDAVAQCEKTDAGPLRQLCEEELAKKQEILYKAQETFKSEIVEKQNKLIQPLNERILKSIKEVALEKGLHYVFDISFGVLLHWDEKDNIDKDVRQKLGIAADAKLDNTNK